MLSSPMQRTPGVIASLARRLVDAGVAETTPMERASTTRALNVILLVLAVLAICGGTLGAVRASPAYFGIGNLVFVLVIILAFLLNLAGLHDAARFTAVAMTAAQYVFLCVGLGSQSGSEFTAIGLAFAPLMIFAGDEVKRLALVYAIYIATAAGVEVFLAVHPPLLRLPPSDLALARLVALVQLSGFCALVVWYYRSAAAAAQAALRRTNERLYQLLANTLPAPIADRLATGETLIADSHAEASVLFADLVGFSELSRRLSPAHLVELLNALFSALDDAAARHGVEKIKTIGDCYMAAAGILGEDGRHVERMAEFALEMPGIGEDFGQALAFRIGICTGPAISGVIGRQKYAFDLWGDTINLASRIAADGEPGRIQVGEAAYWRLHRLYECEKRGAVDLKGYPGVTVYVLQGRLAPAATDATTGGRAAPS
jgi:class 3 adenylate cyclase